MSTLQIRLARPADIPNAIRMLPGIARYPSQTQIYIAENDGEFIGCGSLIFHSGAVCVFNWSFFSVEEKSIVAPALFSLFRAEAERQRMRRLMAQTGVPEKSDDAALLQTFGCQERTIFNFYQTDLERGEKIFQLAIAKLKKNKKIAPEVRVIPLEEAPALPVQALWRESIGVGGDSLIFQFEQQQFSPRHSVVALDGARIVGAIAINLSGKIPVALYMAVEKSYRGRWPYPVLMLEVHANLRKAGHSSLLFKTNSQHHAGIKNFAQKIGGTPCGSEIFYALDI